MTLGRRVIGITSGLVLAGAMTGSLSGAAAIVFAALLLLHAFPPLALLGPSAAIGAAFGAIVAPVGAWTALRQVPLGRAIAGIAIGAGLGGAMGVLMGASAVNPYVPMALTLAPVPQGLAGGLLGAVVASAYLRWRSRRTATSSAPANEEL